MNLPRLISVLLCICLSLSLAEELSNARTPRQLGILNLLRFPNDRCQGNLGRTGTCLTRTQCHFRRGLVVGMCAQGFGICCEITKSCGAEIKDNGTFFVNPSYPGIEHIAQQCSLSVRKQNANICQIRLDFDQFENKGPALDTGKCDSDSFIVTGQDVNSVIPVLCGENQGQHLYLDVGTSNGPISLSMVSSSFNGAGLVGRHWKIRILQIPCNSPWRAPPGCLQYYTTASDDIKSFNYGNQKPNQTGYPAGLQYTVCIRKEMGLCSASFIARGDFGIGDTVTGQPQTDQQCTKDYLMIGEKKYCGGQGFPVSEIPQTHGTGPMQVSFLSEATRTPGNQNPSQSGFNIKYKQNACSRLSYL